MWKNLFHEVFKLIAVFVIAYVLLYFLDASCFIKYIFKVPCPGCGLTRAWICCLRLDFESAFNYNKMFWSIPILIFCCMFKWKGKVRYVAYTIILIILIGFALFWIYGLVNIKS